MTRCPPFRASRRPHPVTPLATLLVLAACQGGEPPADAPAQQPALAAAQRLAPLTGFDGPESALYDPDQDVWFVSNFNGPSGDLDANGYVARVNAEDGAVEALRFAVGTERHPFHAGRGMALQGDTLWVADAGGVHAFHRGTGAQLAFVDMSDLEPGFLNDLAVGPDGTLYATDTGRSAVYRVRPDGPGVAVEGGELGSPNGIHWSAEEQAFWLAPWNLEDEIVRWDPATGALSRPLRTPGATRMDGMAWWQGYLLVASQADSAIHAVSAGPSGPYIRTGGRPADLGLDTRRGRLAVPVVAMNQVEIWQLPTGGAGG
ncbi:MAG: SMP-30/gluconolactonase/LRE family protein [Longimicrobiales bacterium]|nr:SMP-30/gluconolactonase/LRE family protein [Longimicrobiales bacterium]